MVRKPSRSDAVHSSEGLRVYEGSVHRAGLGGGHLHFVGLASALALRLPNSFSVVIPRFTNVESLGGFLPRTTEIVEISAGRRGPLGFLTYELLKVGYFVRMRCCAGRRPVILTRLSFYGISIIAARALGWRIVLEVNGVPSLEARDRLLSLPTRLFISLATRAQLISAHELICVTPEIARDLATLTNKVMTVVPNGVELAKFPAHPAEMAKNRYSIVFVGTLAPWLDVGLVLHALAGLLKYSSSPWSLTIVGDGEQSRELHDLTIRLGLQESVIFRGWVPHEQVSAQIAAAWICVVPLRRKGGRSSCGSPLKLFEYLASNRVVVAAETDGVKELNLPLIERYEEGSVSSLMTALQKASDRMPLAPADLEMLRDSISWNARAECVLSVLRAVERKH